MPYAHGGLCPMPYARRVPHVTEKGYIFKYLCVASAVSLSLKDLCNKSND
jgi:hypothetical protein